jgi:SHAQKYF class myb-like DNA-binding protein
MIGIEKSFRKNSNTNRNPFEPGQWENFDSSEEYRNVPTSKKGSTDGDSSKNEINNGKWTEEEHHKFVEACLKHGSNWPKIMQEIKTRTLSQIRSHAHKYLISMSSQFSHNNIKNIALKTDQPIQKENTPLKMKPHKLLKNKNPRASMLDLNILDKLRINKKLENTQNVILQKDNYREGRTIGNSAEIKPNNLQKFENEVNLQKIYFINQILQIYKYNQLVIGCLENLNYDTFNLALSEQLLNEIICKNCH